MVGIFFYRWPFLKSSSTLRLFILLCLALIGPGQTIFSQGCGIVADAGPDLFTCDPADKIQLQGTTQGSVTDYNWTPTSGLSDPKILDPTVMLPPGRYTFTLNVVGEVGSNLITNGDFEGGNTGFSSNYRYHCGITSPNDYCIGTNPKNNNGNWEPCGDHTTGSGNMMIVDGSLTAGTLLWCQNVAVTPGKMYVFRVFVASSYPANPAIIQITVNGSVIGTVSAPGSTCDWVEGKFCFTATSGSANICLQDLNTAFGGNDFLIDDISLLEKCEDDDEVVVEIVDMKATATVLNKPKCGSQIFTISGAGSSSGPNVTYEWTTNTGTIISNPNDISIQARGAGTYTLKVTYQNGFVQCEEEVSVIVDIPDDLSLDINILGEENCRNDSIYIDMNILNGSGIYDIIWSPPARIVRQVNDSSIIVQKAGNYTTRVRDRLTGCELTQNFLVTADTIGPNIRIDGDSLISCKSTMADISITNFDTTDFEYTWHLPSGSKQIDVDRWQSTEQGHYYIAGINPTNGCTDTISFNVRVDTVRPALSLPDSLHLDCRQQNVYVTPRLDTLRAFLYEWKLTDGSLLTRRDSSGIRIIDDGFVHLTVIDTINGCTSSDTIEITENKRKPDAIAGPDITLTCHTDSVLITGLGTSLQNTWIRWLDTSQNIYHASFQPEFFVSQPGFYIIEVTDTINHCVSTDTLEVDVDRDYPVADAGTELVFRCLDSVLILDGSKSTQGSRFIYRWSTNDGRILSGQNALDPQIDLPGTYQILVIDTVNACRDSAIVVVRPDLNIPEVSIDSVPDLSCDILQLRLQGSVRSPGGNPVRFQWLTNGGHFVSGQDSLNPLVDRGGQYFLIGVDSSNGCTDTVGIDVHYDTIKPTVVIDDPPIWSCRHQSLFLYTHGSDKGGEFQYNWTALSGNYRGGNSRDSLDVVVPGRFVLHIKNTRNGCNSTDTTTIAVDTLHPAISIDMADTLTCLAREVFIQSNYFGSRTPLYQWQARSGGTVGSLSNNVLVVNQPGWFHLAVTDTINSCRSIDSIFVAQNITLPNVVLDSPQIMTCLIREVALRASIAPANSGIQWIARMGGLTGVNGRDSMLVDQPGVYQLVVQHPQSGCSDTSTLLVRENTNIPVVIDYELVQAPCVGDIAEASIINVTGGEKPLEYALDNGHFSTDSRFRPLSPGLHRITVRDSNGCTLTDTFTIHQPDSISINIIPEVEVLEGSDYQMNPIISRADSTVDYYSWNPTQKLSCADCKNPILRKVEEDGSYTVQVINKNGCADDATIRIKVIFKDFWTPNVFSPNSDNINDVFRPEYQASAIKEIAFMQIYDRWGEMVYEVAQPEIVDRSWGWDGFYKNLLAPNEVYVFAIKVIWIDDSSDIFSGDLTLMR